jgi:hypothetical protein
MKIAGWTQEQKVRVEVMVWTERVEGEVGEMSMYVAISSSAEMK